MDKLIAKYLTNTATPSEIEELEKWIKLEKNRRIFEEYVRLNFAANQQVAMPDLLEKKKELLAKVTVKKETRSPFTLIKVWRYAAVFVALFALALYFKDDLIGTKNQENQAPGQELIIADEEILLKNEKGEILYLNQQIDSMAIHGSKGNLVAQQQGSQIRYDLNSNLREELVYNEVVVPYGKSFQVTLSDGTLVHLNAGSSLRFPIKFIPGKERKVFLNGEAFFDVEKSPGSEFVVSSKELDVKVLGTILNVLSYEEDDEVNTVLVEGSVKVYNPASENESAVILSPGQMASWNGLQENMHVHEVDVNQHTAWIHGKLILRKAPFKVIRRKLERHYNVSIQNHNKALDETRYNINFDNESIGQVLRTLNQNFEINYQIINNEVIIN